MTSIALSEECVLEPSEFAGKYVTLKSRMAFWRFSPVEFEEPEAEVTVLVNSVTDAREDSMPSYVLIFKESIDYEIEGELVRGNAKVSITFWMNKETLLSRLS